MQQSGRSNSISDTLQARQGSVSFSMCLAFGVLMLATVGVIQVMGKWKRVAELQVGLDQCVAEGTVMTRSFANGIEMIQAVMTGIRTAMVPAIPFPPIFAGLQRTLQMVSGVERSVIQTWNGAGNFGGVREVLKFGTTCSRFLDLVHPLTLPRLPYRAQMQDALGPKPHEWQPSDAAVYILAKKFPRISRGELKRLGFLKWKEKYVE